jgi:hypothetical protein
MIRLESQAYTEVHVANRIANIEVILPPAVMQDAEHAHVHISTSGASPDINANYPVETKSVPIKVALHGTATVTIIDVLANGKQSPPCIITVVPGNHVEAKPRDPAGHSVRILSIEDAPVAEVKP